MCVCYVDCRAKLALRAEHDFCPFGRAFHFFARLFTSFGSQIYDFCWTKFNLVYEVTRINNVGWKCASNFILSWWDYVQFILMEYQVDGQSKRRENKKNCRKWVKTTTKKTERASFVFITLIKLFSRTSWFANSIMKSKSSTFHWKSLTGIVSPMIRFQFRWHIVSPVCCFRKWNFESFW